MYPAMSVNTVLRARQSARFAGAATVCVQPLSGLTSEISTSRSGSANGSGRSSTAWTTVNIEVAAPTPMASVAIVTAANAGCFRSDRNAYRRSCSVVSTIGSVCASRYCSRICIGPPNRTSAARRASSGVMPWRICSSVNSCRWTAISSSKSASRRLCLPSRPATRAMAVHTLTSMDVSAPTAGAAGR